jgi:competence protein ComEC
MDLAFSDDMDHPFRGQGPVLVLVIPLLLGAGAGLAAGSAWAAVAGLILLASLLSLSARLPPLMSASLVMALCGALAAGRAPLAEPDSVRPLLEREAVLRARIDEVRLRDAGWGGLASDAVVSALDGSASLRLERVRFSVRGAGEPVPPPAEIRATGRLHPIRSFGNPGEFPRELAAMAEGVQYVFSTDALRTVVLPVDPEGSSVREGLLRARNRTRRWLIRHAGTGHGGLYLLSLTTGDRQAPSHPLTVLLRQTGLSHLLAISGLHVAVFFAVHAVLVRCVLWAIRRRRGTPDLSRASAVLSIPVCWGYVLLAGAPVSAVRAAGMITVAVVLWHGFGIRGAGTAWSLLFLGTIAWNPFRIGSASFLLSYGATFFLIAAFGGTRTAGGPGRPAAKALGRVRQALVASAVAFFGTLPISAALFERLPAGAIVWNLLFAPVLGTAGVVGAFVAAVGGVFAIEILGAPVRLAAEGLTRTLDFLGALSGSGRWYVSLPPAGIAAPLLATSGAAWGTLALRRRGREPWPAVAGAALAFLAWIHLPYAALPQSRLTVTALNVGQGDSSIVSFPGGGHMVIDCGSALRGDAGRRVLLPFLRSRGIRRIDVLVLTHPHEDHYGGAEALLEEIAVEEIWIPEGFPARAFGRAVAARASRIRKKTVGAVFSAGGASVIVQAVGGAGDRRNVNERGLLLEILYGNLSVWKPGDVESGPSAWGPVPPKGSQARVLFLPHHGSVGADPAGWLRAAHPDAAVSQKWNCFGHENLVPSVQCFLLENGALTISSNGRTVFLEQARRARLLRFLWRLPG